MITKEYAMAYTEVLEILKYVPDEDIAKIPKVDLDFYRANMDNEYDYKLDMTKEFEEQKMSEITKAILANIFRDYWATPYQKERIEAKERYDLDKVEEEKRQKYNPDNIFKNKEKKQNIDAEISQNSNNALIEYKETFFIKLKNFIFRILHINK